MRTRARNSGVLWTRGSRISSTRHPKVPQVSVLFSTDQLYCIVQYNTSRYGTYMQELSEQQFLPYCRMQTNTSRYRVMYGFYILW